MSKILLLAALPEEADAFASGQGIAIDADPIAVRQVQLGGKTITVVTCGLGKVNAALAVGRYVTVETALVAMTGTCGQIAPNEGDCFWIAHAVQHDYGAKQSAGMLHYRAGDWPMGEARSPDLVALPDPGLGLPHARIASGDVFLECPETAARIVEQLGATLVDMEVAAVAQAATALGLPWAAIKAVTDGADGDSAGDFSVNLRRAASKAAEAMERLISAV
jgi:adenosylhomocysteine nucleosidase